ncbi:HEAT repeat domain-containing protein [Actinotalea sp. AC32]|nr:HEAT repeat domain-containing protein [Actinotalea sp. AC32]
MTAAGAVGAALVALAVVLVVLAVLVGTARWVRLARDRRRRRRAAPLRPLLLEVAAGEPEDAEHALEVLAGLDAARWTAVEGVVGGLLLKVRGETQRALVDLLERRGTLERARRRTRSRSLVARAEAAELLGSTGQARATRDLLPLLEDREAEVRAVAARALGRSGDASAAGPLLERLSSPRDVPARVVASAVLRLGPDAHPALATALRAAAPLERATAAEIAGLAGAIGCARDLLEGLAHDESVEVRIRCARALGRLGPRDALDPLAAATGAVEPTALRAVAARALGDLGDPAAVPRLAALLIVPEHHVATNAARSLTQLGPAGRAALGEAAAAGSPHAEDALATAALRDGAEVAR